MDKAIGGYFELELPLKEEFHKDALRLNSGKNCLEYVLRARQYKKVYIPYYTCDVVLRPFEKLHISYEFYHINIHLELAQEINLKEGEALLYTNYFGLKQTYVESLANKYGSQLIVDNTQAFFAKPLKGIDTFYTCRKFFGVSDGAYLYTDAKSDMQFEQSTSYENTPHLIKRIDLSPEDGFEDFHKSDERLADEKIMLMSNFTQRVMQSIDYENVTVVRRVNFLQLHDHLVSTNILSVQMDADAIPMVCPYMTESKGLRNHLIKNKVYPAKYWPNVDEWVIGDFIESKLANYMVPLPIDQRYGNEEMNRIIKLIHEYERI